MPRDAIVPGCAGQLTSLISHVAVGWLNISPHTLIGAACAPSFYGCWCMSVLVHISFCCFEATVVDVAFWFFFCSVPCAAGRQPILCVSICHAGESACCCFRWLQDTLCLSRGHRHPLLAFSLYLVLLWFGLLFLRLHASRWSLHT